jgi:hypothetical protein
VAPAVARGTWRAAQCAGGRGVSQGRVA